MSLYIMHGCNLGTNKQAVVLLLGAISKHRPLSAIPEELSTINSLFETHQTENFPEYEIKNSPYFTQKDLKTRLDGFADQIAILHFAGHSDPSSIQTDENFVRAEDIAAHIKTWTRRPGLVFLNGCESKPQAQFFLDAGVSAVVATRRAVNDRQAANFAQEFYHSLLSQNGNTSLAASLQQAKAKLGFDQSDESRSSNVDEEETETDSWNWELFLKDTSKTYLSLHQLLTLNRPRYDAAGELINPYQGLAAFREEDQEFFFGREQLTEQLVSTIEETPFLALLGSSGRGKSSLINAGIIPRLRESKDYLIFKTRPGNDPFAEMARCIAEYLYPIREQLDQRIQQSDTLAKKLQKNPEYLSKLLQTCLQDSNKRRLILFIDQFEELFTHAETEPAKEIVKRYETALTEIVTATSGSLTLVLAMRADFLGMALIHQQLATLLDQNSQHTKYLSPMSTAELRSIILEPAAKQGIRVESSLTAQLLEELEKNTESLPLLQHALSLVWKARYSLTLKLVDYTRLGGIEKALETQADQFLCGLDTDEQKERVKRIFLRLINLGEGQDDTRRRVDISAFDPEPETKALLQRLADERLVTTQGNDGSQDSFVEVSHEALIKHWGELRRWINENREQLRVQHKLSQAAKDWSDHQKDASWLLNGSRLTAAEEWLSVNKASATGSELAFVKESQFTKKKRANRVRYSVASVIVVLSGLLIFAWLQQNAALEGQRQANHNLGIALEERSLFSIERGDLFVKENPYGQKAISEFRDSLLYSLEAQLLLNPEHQRSIVPASLGQVYAVGSSILKNKKSHIAPPPEASRSLEIIHERGLSMIASAGNKNEFVLWNAGTGELIDTFKGAHGWLSTTAVSADGKILAVASSKSRSSAEVKIQRWSVDTRETLSVINVKSDPINDLALHPDGKTIATSLDGNIHFWNAKTGEKLESLEAHRQQYGYLKLTYSPAGNIIVASDSNVTKLWRTDTLEPIKAVQTKPKLGGNRVAFSSDGKILAISSPENDIHLWDTDTFAPLETLRGHSKEILSLAFSPDSKSIAAGASDDSIRFWTVDTGLPLKTVKAQQPVQLLSYQPDGNTVLSGSIYGFVSFWQAEAIDLTSNILKGDTKAIDAFAFSPDGNFVAAISGNNPNASENKIRIWDVSTGDTINIIDKGSSFIALAFSPDGETIFSAGSDGKVRTWHIDNGEMLDVIEVNPGNVLALAVSPDGNILASDSAAGEILLSKVSTGKELGALELPSSTTDELLFSPDGSILASESYDGQNNIIRLWDVDAKETIKNLQSLRYTLSFSQDGKLMAFIDVNRRIQIWELGKGKVKKELTTLNHVNGANTLAFDPDSQFIASGHVDGSIRLWNIISGERALTLENEALNDAMIKRLIFSRDGKRIASTSGDQLIRLWGTNKGDLYYTFKSSSASVDDIAFSPSGNSLASADKNNILMWRFNDPMFRLLYDFNPEKVHEVLQFLWGPSLDNRNLYIQQPFDEEHPRLENRNDIKEKLRNLDSEIGEDEINLEQILSWLEKRCAYKHPERYNCTPAKD